MKIKFKIKANLKCPWPSGTIYQLLPNVAHRFKMAAVAWEGDNALKESLLKLVEQGLKRTEILCFAKRDFAQYAWSMRTLDRRLRHFNIYLMFII